MSSRRSGAGRAPRPAPAKRPTAIETPRRLAPTIATIAAVGVIGAYVFVSATFTIPDAPARAAVADGFAPYFSQRWDVFAPKILRVNSAMQMQAQWRDDDGELVTGDWIDVTDMEFAAVRGIPAPSRVSKNSVNALGAYLERYDEVSEQQQERVQDTFIQRDGDGGFEAIPDEDLLAELDELGDDPDAVVSLIRYDYMLTRYLTVFGEAYYDRPIERVRWQAQYDRPNDFLHRFDDERQFPLSTTTFGWRQAQAPDDPSLIAVFDEVQDRYAGEDRS